MGNYIIAPSKDDLLSEYAQKFYDGGEVMYQKLIGRMRVMGEKNDFKTLCEAYQPNDFENHKFTFNYKDVYKDVCVRFERYLDKILSSFDPEESPTVSMHYEVSEPRPVKDWGTIVKQTVPMKEEEFFTTAKRRYEMAIMTVKSMIENNLRITKKMKLFLNECIKYIEFTTQERYFSMKAIDYLHSFKAATEKEISNVNRLTILLYCVYDLLSAKEMYLKIKTRRVRQIVEQKEKKTKRPRYLLIRFRKEDSNPYVSNFICEFLLQMIEKGVLRCSSLTRAFLLTPDEKVFYKYCLINGKICLKRLTEKTTVRV